MPGALIKKLDDLRLACLYTRPELGSLVTEIIPRGDGFYDTLNLSRNASPAFTQFGITRNEGCSLAVGDEAKGAYEKQLSEIARDNDTGTKEGLFLNQMIQRMTQMRIDINGVSYFPVAPGVSTMLMMVQNNHGEYVYFTQECSRGEYVVSLKPELRVTPAMQPVTFVDQPDHYRELRLEDLAFAQEQFRILSDWALGILTQLPTPKPTNRNPKSHFLN